MKPHFSNAPGRKLRACVCLMAMLLLWVPVWAAALQSSGMACCEAGMCPLHGHAPKKSSHDSGAGKQAPAANCEHHGNKAAMDCSMACCHPSETTMGVAIVFVLPGVVELTAPHLEGPLVSGLAATASSLVMDRISPPPRASLLSL